MDPREQERERQTLRHRYAAAVAMGLREEADELAGQLGITSAEVDAHFSVNAHSDGVWEPENFEDFAALPPGRFDPRVFTQTIWWVDVLRRPHRINDPDDFTTDHLRGVLEFLDEEAWRWAEFPDLDARADAGENVMVDLEWFHNESRQLLARTPLVRELHAELARREN